MVLLQTALLAAALACASTAAHAQVFFETRSVAIADTGTVELKAGSGSAVWAVTMELPKAGYTQLVIDELRISTGADVTLLIEDAIDHRVRYSYGPADLAGQRLVTGPIFDGVIVLTVQANAGVSSIRFRVREVLQPRPEPFVPQSIVPNWYQVDKFKVDDPQRKAAPSVAKIFLPGVTLGQPRCTGFLVANDVLITAYHCIAESQRFNAATSTKKRPCGDVQVQFDYFADPLPGPARMVACSVAETWSAVDDFVVLRLASPAPKLPGGAVRPVLKLAAVDANDMDPSWVIHHPIGIPMRISECRAGAKTNTPKPALLHNCSTFGGSSGAPVLNKAMELVGLHVWGPFKQDHTTGAIESGVKAGNEYQNRATPISAMLPILTAFGSR